MRTSTLVNLFVLCYISFSDACNETIVLNKPEMNLTSPYYPQPYHNNENCWWKIVSSSSHMVIGVHVAFIDVEISGNCLNDKLNLYDGLSTSAPKIMTMCGDEENGNMVSSGNALYISFETDNSAVGKGFVLKIVEFNKVTKCSGNVAATLNKQRLLLPDYLSYLGWHMLCTWTISANNKGDIIDITTHPGNDGRQYCQYGNITFYNGNTTSASEIISAVCQDDAASFIRSNQNIMTVVFKVAALMHSGFGLTYSSMLATNCNRTLVATPAHTFIMSPGYPDVYYNDLNCIIWISSVRSFIRIEILSVDVEGAFPLCDRDSLTFYNDLFLNDTKLTLCGKPSPSVMYSTGNTMAIQFRTDSHTVKQGFRLMVTSVLHVPRVTHCGNTSLIATSERQYLTSPNYPRDYQNNDSCIWNITAANPGGQIRLVLVDTDIESSNYGDCSYDSLKAFDVSGQTAAVSAFMTVCGVSQPMTQSRGSRIQLVFSADISTTGRGFKLKYFEIIVYTSRSMAVYTIPVPTVTNLCGGHLHIDSGDKWITSPNWPWNYPHNQHCRWTIQSPVNTNLNLSAEVFHVEVTSNCINDYVQIYDGLGSIPPNTARLCGSDLYNYVSSGNSLTVIFHSDNSGYGMFFTGFSYRVKAGHFTSYSSRTQALYASYDERVLTSPNYPFYYPTNAQMTWKIDSSGENYRVTVRLDPGSLEHTTSCYSNYVEAFDGSSSSAPSLGKFCGSDTSSKTSSGRYMFLKFKSGSSSGPGFKLTYSKENHFASDDDSSSNVGPIIGGILGGIAIIFIIIIIIGSIISKRNKGPTVRTVQQNNMYTISSRALEEPTPATFMPPPSYTVATAGDGANNNPPPL